MELCPELDLSAWVLPTAPQGTDPKHQGTAPLMENPQAQDLAAIVLWGWLYLDTAEALFASAAGKEDKLAFHEYCEFKYNLTKHQRGQATLFALPSNLLEAPKPVQPTPTASDDYSSLL